MPKTAAVSAPIKIARIKRTRETVMTSCMHLEKNALAKAPTHMKPACPRLSSPKMPTVRFKDTARITYTHRGTKSPFIRLDIWPAIMSPWTTR